jgi:DNA-binding MarR family transcriptional regulator
MTKILASLEAAELIERTAHAEDRRQAIISVTDAGRRLIDDETRARDEWLAERLTGLSAQDRETLVRAAEVLDRLGS